MKHRIAHFKPFAAFAAVAGAAAALSPLAAGHEVDSYYKTKYAVPRTVQVYFNSDFPGGRFRDRARDAVQPWNNRPPRLDFNVHSEGSAGTSAEQVRNECSRTRANHYPPSVLFYGPTQIGQRGRIAFTQPCIRFASPNRVMFFFQVYDSETTWYTGTGDAPASAYDFLSIATHEFGHGTGFEGHFDQQQPWSGICANNASRPTMCAAEDPGRERLRTLENHDVHTFDAAYP